MTTQLTITIEESLLNRIGKAEVEKSLEEWITQLQLRAAAKEILEDMSENDMVNDVRWQAARELAWQQEKSKYLVK